MTIRADDIKALMNSLAHRDELGIAKYIPFRRGSQGLHFAEAIGHVARRLDPSLQIELRSQIGDALKPDESALLEATDTATLEGLLKVALEQLDSLVEWFDADAAERATWLRTRLL